MNIEHFMDKYIPIRIQKQISESIKSISGRTQLLKYENFEMEKYKQMNQEVLSEEKDQTLRDISKRLMKDINETIDQLKLIAKKKGINYDNIQTDQSKTNKTDMSESKSQYMSNTQQ